MVDIKYCIDQVQLSLTTGSYEIAVSRLQLVPVNNRKVVGGPTDMIKRYQCLKAALIQPTNQPTDRQTDRQTDRPTDRPTNTIYTTDVLKK